MDRRIVVESNRLGSLASEIARREAIEDSGLLMFNDFTEAVSSLFAGHDTSRNRVLVAGLATPSVEIAIDRAELRMEELPGSSVFEGTPEPALACMEADDEIVYIANPNRVSGASLSGSDIEKLAARIPHGLLVVDEHFHEFYGISAASLIQRHVNIVILRSFTAGFSIGSEAGYIMAGKEQLKRLGNNQPWQRMSRTLEKTVHTTLANRAVQDQRLQMIRDESLRVSSELTRIGLQNRLSPTDFLLLRVAEPERVCNYLAAARLPLENLDGYPGMENFLKYTVQSEISNDRFLQAIKSMPREYYRLENKDLSVQKLHRQPETAGTASIHPRTTADGKKKLASRAGMSLIGSD